MFREDYRREMQKLTPDSSFMEELSDRMEHEERNTRKADAGTGLGKTGWRAVGWGSFAAALVCIAVGITWFNAGDKVYVDDNVMTQNAGGIPEQGKDKEGVFAGSSWYGSEENPEKIYGILLEKLSGDAVLRLTVSGEENFEDAAVLPAGEAEALIETLGKGMLLGSYEEEKGLLAGQPVYYLVEFSDGAVVKFSLYGEQYFYCSEIDGVFELKD